MDLRDIISTTTDYNFHTHTQYCDGRAPIDEMAAAAVAAGMRHVGFTPHSPIPFASPCNMSRQSVDDYVADVLALKDRYEGQCNFYSGMELDYLSGVEAEKFPQLDFTISSVHFIRSQQGDFVDIDGRYEAFKRKMAEHFHDDIRYVVEEYYRSSHEMLAKGGFDILGHFDKISLNGSYYQPDLEQQTWYQRLVDDYIDDIIASGVIVEINTKSRTEHGRFFPHDRYWKRLKEAGVVMPVNSDAHYPDRITASRAEALDILARL